MRAALRASSWIARTAALPCAAIGSVTTRAVSGTDFDCVREAGD